MHPNPLDSQYDLEAMHDSHKNADDDARDRLAAEEPTDERARPRLRITLRDLKRYGF